MNNQSVLDFICMLLDFFPPNYIVIRIYFEQCCRPLGVVSCILQMLYASEQPACRWPINRPTRSILVACLEYSHGRTCGYFRDLGSLTS